MRVSSTKLPLSPIPHHRSVQAVVDGPCARAPSSPFRPVHSHLPHFALLPALYLYCIASPPKDRSARSRILLYSYTVHLISMSIYGLQRHPRSTSLLVLVHPCSSFRVSRPLRVFLPLRVLFAYSPRVVMSSLPTFTPPLHVVCLLVHTSAPSMLVSHLNLLYNSSPPPTSFGLGLSKYLK
ncbi:hypothetical protein B0H15DRAFT_289977 [Mycena belliarum]|uniref:Uncharacterized protein n=1 Tax=Mycena belliarum TaxID=1033014 RepID=A0AAD6XUG7_9AGAR|nr:hypothetical protein B0H15DRAFT_289977 [Mycena belliae]